MRTPAMIRWPGKLASGGVSDAIVADQDIYLIRTSIGSWRISSLAKATRTSQMQFMAKSLRVTGFLTETRDDTSPAAEATPRVMTA